MGGSDAASARYISTKASAITDKIFRPEDRPVLTYLEDDGISVEPEFYVPIIPMVWYFGTFQKSLLLLRRSRRTVKTATLGFMRPRFTVLHVHRIKCGNCETGFTSASRS